MADPTTLQLLLREVAMVVRPLVEIAEAQGTKAPPPIIIDDTLTGPDVPERLDFEPVHRLIDLLRDAGIEPDPHDGAFTAALQSAATALGGLRGILDAAIDGDPSAIRAEDVADLHDGLKALADAGQIGAPAAPPGEVLTRLSGHLVVRHLRENRQALFGLLGLLGIVDAAAHRDRGPDQLRLDRVGDALGDPGGHVRALLGQDDADLILVLRLVEDAIAGLGAEGEIVDVPRHALAGHDPDADTELQALRLGLFEADSPVFIRLFLFLAELAPDATGARGLVAFLNGAGQMDRTVDLGDGWALSIAADAALTPAFGVALRADGMTGVTAGSGALPQAGAALTLANPGRELALFRSQILNVTSGAPEISARLAFDGQGPGWRIEAALPGTTAELSVSGGDGFLARLIPGTASLTVDPKAGYDSREGFFLAPGQGLEVDLPLRFDLGAVLRIEGLSLGVTPEDGGLSVSVSTRASSTLGPISAALDGLGADLAFAVAPGSDAGAALDVSLRLPEGVALGFESGPVRGAGFLQRFPDEGRYAGGASLTIPPVGLTAFGLIDTQLPGGAEGFSFLLFVAGRFAPIPLGFGFNLTSVGGLVGLHRDVDTDALFAAVRSGGARRLLAPEDPVRDAAELTRDAQAIFPVKRGQHVFGPTAQITWGTPKPLVTLDLALALTLPDPLRLIFIAAVASDLPDKRAALVSIRIDAAGVLDFTNSRFDMEGRVHDSHIQGIPLSGGFAVRSGWGAVPELAFSVGGLHPNFEPPANFPSLERMAMDLSRGPSFRLRIEGYFAITSNSLQLGAALDFAAQSGGYGVYADMGFDALLILDPFSLDVAVRAGASLKAGGATICSVRLKGRLTGPGPWRARGSASIELLFFEVSVAFDASFGNAEDGAIRPVHLWNDHVRPALREQAHFRSGAEGGPLVLEGTQDLLMPESPLRFAQKVLPLALDLDQFGGRPIEGPARFEIAGLRLDDGRIVAPGAAVRDRFAPGQFLDLPEADRLSAPAFEAMKSGAVFDGPGGATAGPFQDVDESPEVTIIDAPESGLSTLRATIFGARLGAGLTAAGGEAVNDAPRFTLRDEGWQAASDALTATGSGGTWTDARAAAAGTAPARKTLARNGELEAA